MKLTVPAHMPVQMKVAFKQLKGIFGGRLSRYIQNPRVVVDLDEFYAEYLRLREEVCDALQRDLGAADGVVTSVLHGLLVPLAQGAPVGEEWSALQESPRMNCLHVAEGGDWQSALEAIQVALDRLDGLSDRADRFRLDAGPWLLMTREWIEEQHFVTEGQADRINAIIERIEQWTKR